MRSDRWEGAAVYPKTALASLGAALEARAPVRGNKRQILPEQAINGYTVLYPPSRSEQLDRIDVQGPANPSRTLQLLHCGEPRIEKVMQARPPTPLDEKLRMKAPRAPRHRSGHGPEQSQTPYVSPNPRYW